MLALEKNCQVEGKHRGEKRLSGTSILCQSQIS
jgi:hypothetical protein